MINPEGALKVFEAVPWEELPLYGFGEFPTALDFMHLSAGQETLWAAAGAQPTPPDPSPDR